MRKAPTVTTLWPESTPASTGKKSPQRGPRVTSTPSNIPGIVSTNTTRRLPVSMTAVSGTATNPSLSADGDD
jgi:hypothetical protein